MPFPGMIDQRQFQPEFVLFHRPSLFDDAFENVAAFVLALTSDRELTPEEAFTALERGEVREKRRGRPKRAYRSHEDKLRMKEMHDNGMTYREIGEVYGVDHTCVWRCVKNVQD